MTDATLDFFNTGEIPKSAPAPATDTSSSAPAAANDPVHDWLNSGGANTRTVSEEAKPYFQRVKEAAQRLQGSVDRDGVMAAPIAAAENVVSAATKTPIALLKHGVAEGAYLSGQDQEHAQRAADRTVDFEGFDPQSEAGKDLANLAGTITGPIGTAVKWAGAKIGLSPTGQDVVADLAPMAVPVLPARIKGTIGNTQEAAAATGRGLDAMNARFQELQRIGRGEPPLSAAPQELTPQMVRGQEPIPDHLQPIAAQPVAATAPAPAPAAMGSPVPQSSMPQPAPPPAMGAPVPQSSAPMPPVAAEPIPAPQPPLQPQVAAAPPPSKVIPPQPAPALTIENASDRIKQIAAGAADNEDLAPAALQRHIEADSLPVPMRLSTGQATGDVAKLSDELNKRGAQPAYANLFNEQNGQLIQNANAIRDRVAPDVTDTNHVDNGAALIDSYGKMNAAREAEVSANYKALADANDGNIPVDGKAFAKAVDNTLGNGLVNKREFLPATVERIVQRIGDSDQQMTFDDFTTLRTILAKEARKATQAGDGNASYAVGLVRNELENIPMGPGAEALKPLADTAKNSARALFQDVEADPAWEAAINGKVTPDSFVKKFVINGARDNVATMKANIGADPIANQTIAASAMNYLKERAGTPNDTGNFSQDGYNRALNALRPKLDSLFDPTAAQQVESLGKVARYTQEQPRGSFVNNSNTHVAGARDAALAVGEGVLNVKTGGLSGFVKNRVMAGKAAKEAAESTKPGAGIRLSDLTKGKF